MCNSTIVARATHRPHLVLILSRRTRARAPVLQPARDEQTGVSEQRVEVETGHSLKEWVPKQLTSCKQK